MFSPLGPIKESVEEVKAITTRIHAVAQEVRDHGFSKRKLSDIAKAVNEEQKSLGKVTREMVRIFGETFAQTYQEAIDNQSEEVDEVDDQYGLGYADINAYVSQSSIADPLFESRLNLSGFIEDLRPLFDLIDILAQNTKEKVRLVNDKRSSSVIDEDSVAFILEKIMKTNFFTIHNLSLSIVENTINLFFILFFHQLGVEASKVESLKPLCDFAKELAEYASKRQVKLSNVEAVEN